MYSAWRRQHPYMTVVDQLSVVKRTVGLFEVLPFYRTTYYHVHIHIGSTKDASLPFKFALRWRALACDWLSATPHEPPLPCMVQDSRLDERMKRDNQMKWDLFGILLLTNDQKIPE
jgi:hypothetical protein